MGDSAMAAAAATITVDEEQRPALVPEEAAAASNSNETQEGSSESISSTMRRSKLEELLKRSVLILRTGAFVFSFLSFLFMASNQKGGWMDFHNYEEYRYLLSVSILTCLYTIYQIPRQIHQIATGKEIDPRYPVFYIDFIGDQTMAYLLLSSSSAALPMTDRMRLSNDNAFTDSASASISMALVAFFSLAASSLLSGFKLATHAYA